MDSETLDKIIETGKETNNKDYVIELFIEGQNTLLAELDPLINKLKRVDKDYCIDILRTHIEFLTDAIGLATSHLTKESTQPISPDQALLFASFNKIIKDYKEEIKI
jgi:hypothetical protein